MARQVQETGSDHADVNTQLRQHNSTAHHLRQHRSDDKETQSLGAKIQADQTSLKNRLAERAHDAERREQERRHGLTSAILDALSPPSVGADREQTVIVGTRIAENATHTLAADVLAHSTSLIRNYARLDDLVAEFGSERAESVANTWKENIRQTEEQLRLGARVALKNTKKVLGAVTGGMSGMEDEGDEGDVEMLSGEAKELNYDLQMSLQYAERGVKRMAKAVPFERS